MEGRAMGAVAPMGVETRAWGRLAKEAVVAARAGAEAVWEREVAARAVMPAAAAGEREVEGTAARVVAAFEVAATAVQHRRDK